VIRQRASDADVPSVHIKPHALYARGLGRGGGGKLAVDLPLLQDDMARWWCSGIIFHATNPHGQDRVQILVNGSIWRRLGTQVTALLLYR
jgi:hypothetical protein